MHTQILLVLKSKKYAIISCKLEICSIFASSQKGCQTAEIIPIEPEQVMLLREAKKLKATWGAVTKFNLSINYPFLHRFIF